MVARRGGRRRRDWSCPRALPFWNSPTLKRGRESMLTRSRPPAAVQAPSTRANSTWYSIRLMEIAPNTLAACMCRAAGASCAGSSRSAIERRVKLRGSTSPRSTSGRAQHASQGHLTRTVYGEGGAPAVAPRVDESASASVGLQEASCVSRWGWRFTSSAPSRWANAAISSKPAVPSSGTTTWSSSNWWSSPNSRARARRAGASCSVAR